MKTASLSRRLLAGVAGLALALGGALMVSAPAQATGKKEHDPIVVTQPTCEDAYGYIEIPDGGHWFKYKINGNDAATGTHSAVPGSYEVSKVGKITKKVYWTETVEIYEARGCEEEEEEEEKERKKKVKEPEVTQPTCEDPNGYIHIPGVDRLHLINYTLNGEPVERGSTHAVEPGQHTVVAVGKFTKKEYKTWVIDIVEAEDCEEDEEPPGEEEPPAEEEPPGEGGELPVTGARTLMVAGAALALLTLGGALYFVARRRRISFTA